MSDFEARYKKAMEALIACEELFKYAHPKFNWGASFLDAKAIRMLNETPLLVSKVLDEEGY